MTRRVLILGADGFIGRHMAFALRAAGWHVIAHARQPAALAAMGFETFALDLGAAAANQQETWQAVAGRSDALINCAGLLTGSERAMRAVHETAPRALYAALRPEVPKVLISAVGIDDAETGFARWRRRGETVARASGVTILRPGLVLADTSYGGSSLLRAFAALPLCRPVVGQGTQPFNPVHAADLAAIVAHILDHGGRPGVIEVGGPETVTQDGMGAAYRAWLGLAPVPALRLAPGLARAIGRLGDLCRMGPVSASAVDQLQAGVMARPAADLTPAPRGFSEYLGHRPAGTQDLWQARLYLARPAIRLVLALLWLASGLLGLLLPADSFLPLVPGWPEALMVGAARAGGLIDLVIALALIRNWRPRLVTWAQLGMVGTYTIAFTLLAPALWLLPLGGLLKNLPVLALIVVHGLLARER